MCIRDSYAADWLEEIRLSEEEKADMPTLDTFTIEGKVLAVPYANDYRLSYYNTEHYKEAGIQSAPETWEQVYENAKKLKEAGVSEYPFAIPLNAEEAATTSLIWLAYTMNGAVFHEDGSSPFKCRIVLGNMIPERSSASLSMWIFIVSVGIT